MEVLIKRTDVEEAEILISIQKEAFAEDLLKYHDFESSPATEPVERLIKKINSIYHYTIWCKDEIIGGIDVRKLSDTQCRLSRIFLKPRYQNKGIGTRVIHFIEQEFPDAIEWSLDTPCLSYRNHYLYEKMGYKKIGEHKITEKLVLFDYVKHIHKDI